MTHIEFKEWIFDKFIKWEQSQPGKRSSFSAFARWLSSNSLSVKINQQMVSDWVKGRYKPKEDKYLFTLADKLGLEIFDVLEKTRPDPDLHYIQAHWVNIPPKERKAIREIIAKYETKKDKKESP